MANVEKGSFTVGSTGESDLLVLEGSFTPNYFEFMIGPRTGTNETHHIYSHGYQDLVNDRKVCVSTFVDSTLKGTRRSTTESFTHYKNVSSALTKAIGGYVSYTEAGGFKFTASVADSDYTVDFIAMEL